MINALIGIAASRSKVRDHEYLKAMTRDAVADTNDWKVCPRGCELANCNSRIWLPELNVCSRKGVKTTHV